MRALPPTHLLATFDALIRLRSFRQAADELGLSPSTVSHRLGELEALLGLALFTRTTRSVSPTADGADLHSQIKDPLAALERAFTRRAPRREVVRISALPSRSRPARNWWTSTKAKRTLPCASRATGRRRRAAKS